MPESAISAISFVLPTSDERKGVLDARHSKSTNGEHSIFDGNRKRSAL